MLTHISYSNKDNIKKKIYLRIVLTDVIVALLDLLLVETLGVLDLCGDLGGIAKLAVGHAVHLKDLTQDVNLIVQITLTVHTHGNQSGDDECGDEEARAEEATAKITDGCSRHVEMNIIKGVKGKWYMGGGEMSGLNQT